MKKFNRGEYAIDKTNADVVQVTKKLQNGNLLVIHEVYEPDWEGNAYHFKYKVVKAYNLARFTKANMIKFLKLSDFELGMLAF